MKYFDTLAEIVGWITLAFGIVAWFLGMEDMYSAGLIVIAATMLGVLHRARVGTIEVGKDDES